MTRRAWPKPVAPVTDRFDETRAWLLKKHGADADWLGIATRYAEAYEDKRAELDALRAQKGVTHEHEGAGTSGTGAD